MKTKTLSVSSDGQGIILEEEVLSDGSSVYNVVLRDTTPGGGFRKYRADGEAEARLAYNQLQCALFDFERYE